MRKKLQLIITGGTIDSVFDPARDMIVVNDASTINDFLSRVIHPHFEMTQEVLTMKDSREITENIRRAMLSSILNCQLDNILITHGTYTMADSARFVKEELGQTAKTIVFTGSFLPLEGFAPSDAPFNIGFAIGSLFLANPGVYVAMNGCLFQPEDIDKNLIEGRFENRQ